MRLSRTYPVGITIGWGAYSDAPLDGDGADSPGEMEALLSPLLSEAHRWRGLALAVRNYSLTFPVLGNFQWIVA